MRFNSKLVRLKAIHDNCSGNTLPSFQFQTGAIKSRIAALPIPTARSCFNSKLVRLKEKVHFYALLIWLCFNSKLVRLKAVLIHQAGHYPPVFQFQTGAIKSSRQLVPVLGSPCLFQFQTGAIKRGGSVLGALSLRAFQFQTGAIKSDNPNARFVPARVSVSIPNWCD